MTSTSQPTTGADPLARLHAPETQQRAVELLQRWMDERDTRFTVEDFVSVCTESDMEELDMLKLGQARRTIARLDSPVRTR
jgi:EAL domain-containing protein (putative c-di-GMP-specific phosphodiesterase class I)